MIKPRQGKIINIASMYSHLWLRICSLLQRREGSFGTTDQINDGFEGQGAIQQF